MAPQRIALTARDLELHSPWMRRLARALVGHGDVADDVVQDTWVRLAGSPPDREVGIEYVVGLVRSLAHGRRRGEARRAVREERSARDEALPSTAEVAARVEVARRLAEALEQLDEPYRTTLVLRYYDELSAAEIARRAGIPAGTVRARLKRGLDLLRARLDDGDGGRASWMSALMPLWPAHMRSSAAGVTATAALTTTTLLTMKLTLALTLCALAAFLAWTFVGRGGAGERALDSSAGDDAALVAADLAEVDGGAARRATTLVELEPEAALAVDSQPDGAAAHASRATVVARATTREGRPIQGAWLRVALAEQHVARSELDGRLELALERAVLERLASTAGQRLVAFDVGAAGFSCRSVVAEFVAGSERLVLGDVVLRPGGALSGRVVDESGLGVEGALVVFGAPAFGDEDAEVHARRGPPDVDPASWEGRTAGLTTHSGPGGSFRLDGVPVGYGVAWARTATSLWAFSDPIGVRAGDDVGGIELVVRDAQDRVISGRVVDPDGHAMAGIDLMFQPTGTDGSEGWNIERTDGEGGFHFIAPDGRAQDINVSWGSAEWNAPNRVGIAVGTHDLVLAFERASWLEVAVLDDEGRPVVNGKVRGVPGTGPTTYPLPRCEGTLDGAGHARLRRPEQALRVRIEAPGYRDALVGPFEPSAFPEPLVVTLTPVRALVGRVVLPDGRPAAGARVSLHQSASGPGTGVSAQARHLTHQGWTGDRDAFVYALRVDPTVVVRADGEGRFRLALPGVDARSAEESDARPDSVLSEVDARGSAARRLATVDPRQPWFLHAVADGHATITSGPHVFDPARDASLDLQLPLGGAIAGKLVRDGVGSAHGWTACASDGLAETARAMVAEDGTFRFERLHAGPWQIRVFEPSKRFHPGGRMITERVPEPEVHVVAGETVEYEHRADVVARAQLVGRLSIDGAPPGALVVVVSTKTPESAFTTTRTALDPDGRFEVSLKPGLKTTVSVIGPYRGAELTIDANVEIAPVDNDWSFAFDTARLEVHVDPTGLPDSPTRPTTYLVEHGPVTVRVKFDPSEPGHYGPSVVPAGRGRLDAPTNVVLAPSPVWAELELAPGELRVLDLR